MEEDSSRFDRDRVIVPDEALPNVEAPSAAFLVQLFVVPGIIVSIIVFVWLAFHWLAHLGNDPQGYVRTLRRDNEGRWQAALNLANDLRGPGGGALKSDESLAVELGKILDSEAASGRTAEQSLVLRQYLCRALGEFSTPAALNPLITRIDSNDDPMVRTAAVEAIAVLWSNLLLGEKQPSDASTVNRVVFKASQSVDAKLRSASAFALGIIGGDGTKERLQNLAHDEIPDVRFNAATSLARLGSKEAVETLREMLSLPDEPVLDDLGQAKRYRRAMIVLNALRAMALLVDSIDEVPEGVLEQVKKLESDPVADVRSSAIALSKKLSRHQSAEKLLLNPRGLEIIKE